MKSISGRRNQRTDLDVQFTIYLLTSLPPIYIYTHIVDRPTSSVITIIHIDTLMCPYTNPPHFYCNPPTPSIYTHRHSVIHILYNPCTSRVIHTTTRLTSSLYSQYTHYPDISKTPNPTQWNCQHDNRKHRTYLKISTTNQISPRHSRVWHTLHHRPIKTRAQRSSQWNGSVTHLKPIAITDETETTPLCNHNCRDKAPTITWKDVMMSHSWRNFLLVTTPVSYTHLTLPTICSV